MRKELKELFIIATVLGILYITGLHTEVLAVAQRALLITGIYNADTEESTSEEYFDYSQVLKTPEGELVPMESFKGKVIFLNLWASWCGPCRAEMPGIESLYAEMKDEEGIEFIMLSVDRNEKAALRFIDRMDFEFPSYTTGSTLIQSLRVPSIPTTFVIGADGRILKKHVGLARYDTKSFKKFLIRNLPQK